MTLTPQEEQIVINFLDEFDRSIIVKILATLESFSDWLSRTFYLIYIKIQHRLQRFWQSIRNFFS
jgi:hypothetical protein